MWRNEQCAWQEEKGNEVAAAIGARNDMVGQIVIEAGKVLPCALSIAARIEEGHWNGRRELSSNWWSLYKSHPNVPFELNHMYGDVMTAFSRTVEYLKTCTVLLWLCAARDRLPVNLEIIR